MKFSRIARSGLERPDVTPLGFTTDNGLWVRLHDMQFLGFDYQIEPPTVTTHFRYDDPEWAPPGAGRTPVAVSRFSDVQVRRWEDDVDRIETPAEYRGQVSDLRYHQPTNVFSLLTLNSSVLFSAGRLDVTLEPRTDR